MRALGHRLRIFWDSFLSERILLVQRFPNLCPKIYVVLYFVSTQIDRMYISEVQSSECDDNLGATVRYFNSFHQTHAPLYGHDQLSSVLTGVFYCSLFWSFKLFSDMEEIVWSVLVQQFVCKTEQIPMTRSSLECFTCICLGSFWQLHLEFNVPIHQRWILLVAPVASSVSMLLMSPSAPLPVQLKSVWP